MTADDCDDCDEAARVRRRSCCLEKKCVERLNGASGTSAMAEGVRNGDADGHHDRDNKSLMQRQQKDGEELRW